MRERKRPTLPGEIARPKPQDEKKYHATLLEIAFLTQ